MKKYLENKTNLWDSFVDFMNSLYWEDCLDSFTPEEIEFNWNEFIMYTTA